MMKTKKMKKQRKKAAGLSSRTALLVNAVGSPMMTRMVNKEYKCRIWVTKLKIKTNNKKQDSRKKQKRRNNQLVKDS